MKTATLRTAPRRKPATKPKKVASKIAGKDIVYISSHATSEQDIVESLLGILFGRNVCGYLWEKPELRSRLSENDPCCVIISPPLDCEQKSMRAIQRIVRKNYPGVPSVWLLADSNYIPDFISGNDPSVRLLVTEAFGGLVQAFVRHLAELTGIKPSVIFRK